jgi:spermidine synthase
VALVSALLASEQYGPAEREARALLARTTQAWRSGRLRHAVAASDPEFHYFVAHEQLGRALLCLGRPAEAIGHLMESLRGRPDSNVTHHNLAVALLMAGRPQEARRAAEQAVSLAPTYGAGRAFYAFVLVELGEYAEAARSYRRALALAPELVSAKLELAWLLATCPQAGTRDGREAVSLAQAVCRATGEQSVRALDVLAAAYAEAGCWGEAVRTGRAAVHLAQGRQGALASEPPGVTGTVPWVARPRGSTAPEDIQRRVQRYEKGVAYRDGGGT